MCSKSESNPHGQTEFQHEHLEKWKDSQDSKKVLIYNLFHLILVQSFILGSCTGIFVNWFYEEKKYKCI